MSQRCDWCLEDTHTITTCPARARLLLLGVAVPDARSDADDAFDALQMRFLRQRTFSFGLLDVIKKGGLVVPPEILQLSPDPLDAT